MAIIVKDPLWRPMVMFFSHRTNFVAAHHHRYYVAKVENGVAVEMCRLNVPR